jgi:hypothetical protein
MSLAQCRECEGKVAVGAKSCPHCGAKKPAPPPPPWKTATDAEKQQMKIVGIVIAVILGGALLIDLARGIFYGITHDMFF